MSLNWWQSTVDKPTDTTVKLIVKDCRRSNGLKDTLNVFSKLSSRCTVLTKNHRLQATFLHFSMLIIPSFGLLIMINWQDEPKALYKILLVFHHHTMIFILNHYHVFYSRSWTLKWINVPFCRSHIVSHCQSLSVCQSSAVDEVDPGLWCLLSGLFRLVTTLTCGADTLHMFSDVSSLLFNSNTDSRPVVVTQIFSSITRRINP